MTTRLCCTLLRSLWMIDQTGGIEYGIIPGRLRGMDTTSGPKLSKCHWSDNKKKRKRKSCRMYCTHLAPGALEEHPVLSGPALQMSSPGTARLDPHCHSLPSSSLLTASPHSFSLTSHERNGCIPYLICLSVLFRALQSSVATYVEKRWQQRVPIWRDADAQTVGLASCLSHLAPSALG